MTKSILQKDKCCFVCMKTYGLHKHLIFNERGREEISEREGCFVYLCARHHLLTLTATQKAISFDIKLKQICQKKWEELNGSREDFIKTFGRNYMEVDE